MSTKKSAKQWLVGIDEAGRGPLAGPVSVGVFAVNGLFDASVLEGIRDSKKLSEKKREMWHEVLTCAEHARGAVGFTTAEEIDTHGIVWAIRHAMRNALRKLNVDPEECTVLLDGSLEAPSAYKDQRTIIKGDATEPVISAAAILAKVERDHKMKRYGLEYPEYGFEVHKGYGTASHIAQIRSHGLSPIHRTSFCKNIH